VQVPAIGYGIRYEFGIFDQRIETDGRSKSPTSGCATANPWEIARPKSLSK
jgi:starch phosphorylase